jgi:hypothetical protein
MKLHARLRHLGLGLAIAFILTSGVFGNGPIRLFSGAAAQTTGEILAAQLREQGYRCKRLLSAKRDIKRSKPDEAFWIVRCREATYSMRLDPDMSAHVIKLK